MRLAAVDARRVADVIAVLDTWTGPLAIEQLIDQVGETIDVDQPLAYSLAWRGSTLGVAWMYGYRAQQLSGLLDKGLEQRPDGFLGYSPIVPKPNERNLAFTATPSWVSQFGVRAMLERCDLERAYHFRSLICDGPRLLAWVGGLQEAPPTRRQKVLLNRLIPALQRRLSFEQRTGAGGLMSRALEVMLDRLGTAAFVLGHHARLEHANAAGWARLQQEGTALLARLGDACCRSDVAFEVRPLEVPGHTGYLVLERPSRQGHRKVQKAAKLWNLTPRQVDVLQHLVCGHSNQRIAAELGISVGTVELHVSALLVRGQVENRSSLIASVWSLVTV